ncbi:hypothetical protein [Mesorhizobium sp.]|uniref:hypothetical protein n=1 Tax=Mesorhizobium sp. TaxID=1871066 RepID=UPI00257E6B63|nr:hypothetical protein [Mesorhizobium sp.]
MSHFTAFPLVLAAAIMAAAPVPAGEPDLVRADRFVELPTGERLFVREVRRLVCLLRADRLPPTSRRAGTLSMSWIFAATAHRAVLWPWTGRRTSPLP